MASTKTKTLSEPRLAAARAFISRLVERDFGGNMSAAATRWGLSQPQLSDFLGGRGGVGMKVLEAVADYANVPIDEVIGRSMTTGVAMPIGARRRAMWRLHGLISEDVIREVFDLPDANLSEMEWLLVATNRQREREVWVVRSSPAPLLTSGVKAAPEEALSPRSRS